MLLSKHPIFPLKFYVFVYQNLPYILARSKHEATQAIRTLPEPKLASIPIIAMTANAFAEDVQAAKEAGMDAHVAKPLSVEKMMKTLTEVLSTKGNR